MSFKKSQIFIQFFSFCGYVRLMIAHWLREERWKNEKRQSSLTNLNGCNNLLLIHPNLSLSFSLFYSSFCAHCTTQTTHLTIHRIVICPNWTSKRKEKNFLLVIKISPTQNRLARLFISISTLCWLQTRHHQCVCVKHEYLYIYIFKGNIMGYKICKFSLSLILA